MKRVQALWLLALINLLLLGALCIKSNFMSTPANAQRVGGGAAPRGDYVALPAKANNNPNGIIFLLDSRNAKLSGFAYEHSRGALMPLKPLDLNRVFVAPPARNP
jgi:hypothetical protein